MPAKDGDVLVATRVAGAFARRLDALARSREVSRSEIIRAALRKELA